MNMSCKHIKPHTQPHSETNHHRREQKDLQLFLQKHKKEGDSKEKYICTKQIIQHLKDNQWQEENSFKLSEMHLGDSQEINVILRRWNPPN